MPESRLSGRQLALGTISFAACFAAWGLIGAFAPRFREMYGLTASETALLVAVPVLLGSLARLPMGIITDRLKGRSVFTALMLFAAIPAFVAPMTSSYGALVAAAFFLGVAGSCFAVGVGFVSPWYSRKRQGMALGVYGLGNAGQSAVVFPGPLLAVRVGWENVFRGYAVLLVIWAAVFAAFARNAEDASPKATRSLGDMLQVLGRERLSSEMGAGVCFAHARLGSARSAVEARLRLPDDRSCWTLAGCLSTVQKEIAGMGANPASRGGGWLSPLYRCRSYSSCTGRIRSAFRRGDGRMSRGIPRKSSSKRTAASAVSSAVFNSRFGTTRHDGSGGSRGNRHRHYGLYVGGRDKSCTSLMSAARFGAMSSPSTPRWNGMLAADS